MSAGTARSGRTLLAALGACCALQPVAALSQAPGGMPNAAGIYSCVDGKGRRLTSDRPIPECLDREQAVRNSDGSVRGTLPPSYTAEERAARDEQRRRAEATELARKDRLRRDRNLLARFQDTASHQRAREAALEPIRQAAAANEKRLQELERERRTLANEAEFYVGHELPRPLKARIDANRATIDAQRAVAANNDAERARINARYDEELAHLRQLWAGAPAGAVNASSGPPAAEGPASPAAR